MAQRGRAHQDGDARLGGAIRSGHSRGVPAYLVSSCLLSAYRRPRDPVRGRAISCRTATVAAGAGLPVPTVVLGQTGPLLPFLSLFSRRFCVSQLSQRFRSTVPVAAAMFVVLPPKGRRLPASGASPPGTPKASQVMLTEFDA